MICLIASNIMDQLIITLVPGASNENIVQNHINIVLLNIL